MWFQSLSFGILGDSESRHTKDNRCENFQRIEREVCRIYTSGDTVHNWLGKEEDEFPLEVIFFRSIFGLCFVKTH